MDSASVSESEETRNRFNPAFLQYRRGMMVTVGSHHSRERTFFDMEDMDVADGKSVMHFFLRRDKRGGFQPYISDRDEHWKELRESFRIPIFTVSRPFDFESRVQGCCVFCFLSGSEKYKSRKVMVKQLLFRDERTMRVDQSFVFGVCPFCSDERNTSRLDGMVREHLHLKVLSYHVYDVSTRAKKRSYAKVGDEERKRQRPTETVPELCYRLLLEIRECRHELGALGDELDQLLKVPALSGPGPEVIPVTGGRHPVTGAIL